MAEQGLIHGPIRENCLHLCVDMQRLFAPGGPWEIPWAQKVLPAIEQLTARYPYQTLFTRFIPAIQPTEAGGTWARYYQRWINVTLANINPDLVELMPPLARFVPPAKILDKHVYSPWIGGHPIWLTDRHAGHHWWRDGHMCTCHCHGRDRSGLPRHSGR